MFSVPKAGGTRREYPNWATRARIRKLDADGTALDGQYACAGEVVRVSPRYQRNGLHFRVRPERPAAFFAAFLHEGGALPEPLTAEECEQEWALELLDPLWQECKHLFHKLESPLAACDQATVPSHRVGFSFNIPQTLVEPMGTARGSNGTPLRPSFNGAANPQAQDQLRARIAEMRARAATKPDFSAKKKS